MPNVKGQTIGSIVVFFALMSLAACGWQLRGQPPALDFNSIRIEGASLALNKALKRQLRATGVTVSEYAMHTVEVTDEDWRIRTVAVDPAGRTVEQEVQLSLSWFYDATQGSDDRQSNMTEAASKTTSRLIRISRNATVDPNNALASSDETNEIQADLREEAARLLIQHIRHQSRPGSNNESAF